MSIEQQPLDQLKEIKRMMEKSSRFISLSGWSGVAAGVCALIGAFFAYQVMCNSRTVHYGDVGSTYTHSDLTIQDFFGSSLLHIAILTFVAAFILAFAFTYLRSRNKGIAIWSTTSRRLLLNVMIPMIVGGVYLLRLIQSGTYGLIAPGCLIFYGLALLNGSKYTLNEIRYLGYCEIALGLMNCWYPGWGLYFWAVGFGILHIIYGIVMWNKYERNAG